MQVHLFIVFILIADCRCLLQRIRDDGIECNYVLDPETGVEKVDPYYPVIVTLTSSGLGPDVSGQWLRIEICYDSGIDDYNCISNDDGEVWPR